MKRVRHVVFFAAVVIVVSIVTGFIYGMNHYFDLTDYMQALTNHNNLFFNHFLILLLFLISTLSILGVVFQVFIISFEGVSIGYVLSTFYLNFKIKGFFYGFITVLVNQVFLIIILSYLLTSSYLYIKRSFQNLFGGQRDYFKAIVMPILYKYVLIAIFVLLYDIILYFGGNILLNYLTFML